MLKKYSLAALLLVFALFFAGCSEGRMPAQTPAPAQAPTTPAPTVVLSEAEKLLSNINQYGYSDVDDIIEKSGALEDETIDELFELCSKGTIKDRVNAALILHSINKYHPVSELDGTIYDLLCAIDYRDEAFWTQIKAHSVDLTGSYACFAMLFGLLTKEGSEDKALHIIGLLNEQCAPNDYGEIPGKSTLVDTLEWSTLARCIYENPKLFYESSEMFIQEGFFENFFALTNYYEGFFDTLQTPDEACALFNYIGSEVYPAAKAIPMFKEDMVKGYDREEKKYEINYNNGFLMNFELQESTLPALRFPAVDEEGILSDEEESASDDEGMESDEETLMDGKYVIVRRNEGVSEEHGIYPLYIDGNLMLLLPDEYRAASFSDADRIIYIETTYAYAFDYGNGMDGYKAVDEIYIFDKSTGEFLLQLATKEGFPPEMLTIYEDDDRKIMYGSSANETILMEILRGLHALPWGSEV